VTGVTVEELETFRQPRAEAALHVLCDLARNVLTVL
jgi:hypothetical protein